MTAKLEPCDLSCPMLQATHILIALESSKGSTSPELTTQFTKQWLPKFQTMEDWLSYYQDIHVELEKDTRCFQKGSTDTF